MRRTLALALIWALTFGVVSAKENNECITAAGSVEPDFALPHVAQAIANKKLDITVLGSASSELNGPAGTSIAYPTRLQIALSQMLPGVTVKVSTYAKARDTASDMESKLDHIIAGVQARARDLADRDRRRHSRRRPRRVSHLP